MNLSSENQKLLSTGALILSVIMLLGALGLALWPTPSLATQIQKFKRDTANAQYAGKKARELSEAGNKAALALTWSAGADIGPSIYADMDKIASGLNVKLVGFRPQRTVDAGDVTQLPFVVNANGSYNNVLSFVRKLETPPTKVVIELLQLGSSEESSDQVVATIGVEAYVLNSVSTTTTTTTTTITKPGAVTIVKPGAAVTKTQAPASPAPKAPVLKIIQKKPTEVKSGN